MTSIPKLQDVLNDSINPTSPFSKLNFIQYLVSKHCVENYEFYTELTVILKIVADAASVNQATCGTLWTRLFTEYIESGGINLPESVTTPLSKYLVPSYSQLVEIRKLIYNYIYTSYCEFASDIKEHRLRKQKSLSYKSASEEPPNATASVVSAAKSSIPIKVSRDSSFDSFNSQQCGTSITSNETDNLKNFASTNSTQESLSTKKSVHSHLDLIDLHEPIYHWNKFTKKITRWRRSSNTSLSSQ